MEDGNIVAENDLESGNEKVIKNKAAIETLANSLDSTQRNAVNTDDSIQQVLTLSGEDMHKKTIAAILADPNLTMDEKLERIDRENKIFDQRQETNMHRVVYLKDIQTKSVGAATGWWSHKWGWVLAATVIALAAATPQARKALKEGSQRQAA